MMVEGVADEAVVVAVLIILLICIFGYLLFAPKYAQQRGGGGVDVVDADIRNDIARFDNDQPGGRRRRNKRRTEGGEEDEKHNRNDGGDAEDEYVCPFCLDHLEFGIQSNCNHHYCGECFFQYYEHKNAQLACCLCRRNVDLVQELFTEEEFDKVNNEDRDATAVMDKINDYNELYAHIPRSCWQQIRETPLYLGRLLRDVQNFGFTGLMRHIHLARGYAALLKLVVASLGGLLYFISPIDLIPEAMFGLVGLIDDVCFVVFILVYIGAVYRFVCIGLAQRRAVRAAAI